MIDKQAVIEIVSLFLLAALIVIPIKLFVFQAFVIKYSSMEPNYHQGDYLIVDELTYHFRDPHRGEVVILHYPLNPKELFIKRIIGLPGETVLIKNGKVFISKDGREKLLEEPYLPKNTYTPGDISITLKPDEYFVLGDNRLYSSDSRMWGPVKREAIIGRVFLRPFSLVEFRKFIQSFSDKSNSTTSSFSR
jgi:signal peptidase I